MGAWRCTLSNWSFPHYFGSISGTADANHPSGRRPSHVPTDYFYGERGERECPVRVPSRLCAGHTLPYRVCARADAPCDAHRRSRCATCQRPFRRQRSARAVRDEPVLERCGTSLYENHEHSAARAGGIRATRERRDGRLRVRFATTRVICVCRRRFPSCRVAPPETRCDDMSDVRSRVCTSTCSVAGHSVSCPLAIHVCGGVQP